MNPSLDYLHQYPVKEVLAKDDGSGYGIEFGGGESNGGKGTIIGIENATEIPELADKVLVTTVYTVNSVTLIFGNVNKTTNEIVDRVEVTVSPSDYFIIDPRFGGEAFYPGRPLMEVVAKRDSIREKFGEGRGVVGRFTDGPDEPVEADGLGNMPDMPHEQT